MKLLAKNKKNRGIAMTEYLIILGIVAIAAIAVVGLFGQQIKNTFYRTTSTLGGTDTAQDQSTSITKNAATDSTTTETMNSFDKKKNNGK